MTNAVLRTLIDLVLAFMFVYTGWKHYNISSTILNQSIAYAFWALAIMYLNIVVLFVSSEIFMVEEPYGLDRGVSYSLGDYIVFPFVLFMLFELSGLLIRFAVWVAKAKR